MLLLDHNEDRSLQISFNKSEESINSKRTINFDTDIESIQSVSAKVHIDTLSPYNSFGEGIYTMTVVKKMSATDDFLDMSFKERACQVELYEDCRTKKLLDKCKCVPWEVPGHKVRRHEVFG